MPRVATKWLQEHFIVRLNSPHMNISWNLYGCLAMICLRESPTTWQFTPLIHDPFMKTDRSSVRGQTLSKEPSDPIFRSLSDPYLNHSSRSETNCFQP
ncbi:hypothetical protein AVEN_51160-1 [Araneus ventricosus]|uniref:Uncharacterized protein n=1 Tax=Araneus ventricosus TaxID=182803 RepID=A0A4Y2WZT1_ARAVE|nr:hypothetical protein AVEN_51160-1 [Araneus ventricosus]